MKGNNILFTGGGGAGTELIYNTLYKKYNLYFADANSDLDIISDVVPKEQRIHIPYADSPKFTHEIIKICKEFKIDVLVPGVDEELTLLPMIRQKLVALKIICPQDSFITNMLDKKIMSETLKNIGVETPIIRDQHSVIDGNSYVMKPRVGRGSRGVVKINSQEQIGAYLKLYQKKADEIIVQDEIFGTEYTIIVSCNDKGNLIDIMPLRVNSKKGITLIALTDYSNNVVKVCEKICAMLKPIGVFNVQLIVDKINNPFVIEINPRISTTTCLGFFAGCDVIDNFINGKDRVRNKQRLQLKLTRTWHNQLRVNK